MHAIAVIPGMVRMASPAFAVAVNCDELSTHGPKCVLLLAAARSASDQTAVILTSEVSMSAIGTPACASPSPVSDPRCNPGIYQLSSSGRSSFHHGARDNDTTR